MILPLNSICLFSTISIWQVEIGICIYQPQSFFLRKYICRWQCFCPHLSHCKRLKWEFAGFRPSSRFSYYTVAIPTMITKSNVFLDPIIYFGMNPQVMMTMMMILILIDIDMWIFFNIIMILILIDIDMWILSNIIKQFWLELQKWIECFP